MNQYPPAEPLLIWLDLETTGLEPEVDTILSIGCIATTVALVELDRREWVLRLPAGLTFSDPKAKEMHVASGLLERCGLEGESPVIVHQELLEWLRHDQQLVRYLAGSSVHFDQMFLRKHMPQVAGLFHYRQLNVSTLKLLANLWLGLDPARRAVAHTPLADLEWSIAELRLWQRHLLKEGIGP